MEGAMTGRCMYCGNRLPQHGVCCRVPEDLDRMKRVHDMLSHTHRNDYLLGKLHHYLVEFGRMSEQPAE